MTNKQLAAKLIEIATKYKTLYVMGCFGAPMTATNKKRYTSNHSYNKDSARTAMINAASEDTFGFDCVCLIKGVLWGWSGDKTKTYGGAGYNCNGVPDIGADTMITKCSGVSTDFSKIEVGEAVWMSGHIGVYVGNGLAVECTPKWENDVQITSCNCTKSGYNRRNWTKHGKLPYVTYEAVEDTQTPTIVTPVKEVKGIDVSKWQGEIDWAKVKASGISFAMIRLGYGSKDGSECGVDGYFAQNVTNALKAGVNVGCYFYSYALSVAAAKKEAQFVVNVLSKYKGVFTYPISFDLEDSSQQALGKTTLTNMVIAFGDVLENAGYWCSLYSNLNWLSNYLDDSKLTRFDHWVAQWASNCTYANTSIRGMWQYSSKGSVSGINGNVDMDIAYKDYPTVIHNAKCNGFTSASQSPTVPNAPETSQNAPQVPVVTPPTQTPTCPFKKGDKVKIVCSDNTKYNPTSSIIPSWVKNDYVHVVTQTTSNGKSVVKGGKVCVLLGKKIRNNSSVEESGVNTWVAVDILQSVSGSSSAKKSVDEIAREVINGAWGNGADRVKRLTDAGYNASEVQTRVNALLAGSVPTYPTYTVKSGDTLWGIAAKTLGAGARYPEIKKLNGLTSDLIHSGQVLKIPQK